MAFLLAYVDQVESSRAPSFFPSHLLPRPLPVPLPVGAPLVDDPRQRGPGGVAAGLAGLAPDLADVGDFGVEGVVGDAGLDGGDDRLDRHVAVEGAGAGVAAEADADVGPARHADQVQIVVHHAALERHVAALKAVAAPLDREPGHGDVGQADRHQLARVDADRAHAGAALAAAHHVLMTGAEVADPLAGADEAVEGDAPAGREA